MNSILWTILWWILQSALSIGKDIVARSIELVTEAQTLKHDDGTLYSGSEKYEFVFEKLKVEFANSERYGDIWNSTYNLIIELAVAFMKGKKA